MSELLGALERLARLPPEAMIALPATPQDTLRSAILLRAGALPAPLKVVESAQSSERSTLTQNALLFATAPCVVASLLMHASTVGGSAVAEHTAVAVMP